MMKDEVRFLPYEEKNFQFITGSKMKEFDRCEFCYHKRYIELVPDPTQIDGAKDYFLVGLAFDDLMTFGMEVFARKYVVVKRRDKNRDDGILELTEGMYETIMQMHREFMANDLFSKPPKKKLMFHKYGPHVIKVEMDDFDEEAKEIRDIKSTASIATFDPDMYKIQASLYHWIVEENTLDKYAVKYEVADKYDYFSRSQLYIYEQSTLMAHRGELLSLLERIQAAHDMNLFFPAKRQDILFKCPYYGHEGHGRPTKPVYC